MRVLWSYRAARSLHALEDYILRTFGETRRQQFMTEAEDITRKLADFPNMGKHDPLLAHRKKEYRSLVMTRKTKLVYYIEGQRVIIANIWDSRREPKTVTKNM